MISMASFSFAPVPITRKNEPSTTISVYKIIFHLTLLSPFRNPSSPAPQKVRQGIRIKLGKVKKNWTAS